MDPQITQGNDNNPQMTQMAADSKNTGNINLRESAQSADKEKGICK